MQQIVSITIAIPHALVARYPHPALLQIWLEEQGLWPRGTADARWRIDPVRQGMMVDISLPVAVPAV
jgi:hypothetical protein